MATKRKAYTKMMCAECKKVNYFAHKSKMSKIKEGEQKLEFKKFCGQCRKHTPHKESKR
jgi:ribosomal protein L33